MTDTRLDALAREIRFLVKEREQSGPVFALAAMEAWDRETDALILSALAQLAPELDALARELQATIRGLLARRDQDRDFSEGRSRVAGHHYNLVALASRVPEPPQGQEPPQVDLPPEAARILHDNRWELYGGESLTAPAGAAGLREALEPCASCETLRQERDKQKRYVEAGECELVEVKSQLLEAKQMLASRVPEPNAFARETVWKALCDAFDAGETFGAERTPRQPRGAVYFGLRTGIVSPILAALAAPVPTSAPSQDLELVLNYARGIVRDETRWRGPSGEAYFESNMRRVENRQKLSAAIERLSVPTSAPEISIAELRGGEENDGPLESTDLFLDAHSRGISLLINVEAGQSFSYSAQIDGVSSHGMVGAPAPAPGPAPLPARGAKP